MSDHITASVDSLLANYPPDIQAISYQLHTMVIQALPEAHIHIYHAAINYAVSTSLLERICYLAPQQKYVTLGFFFGATLADPQHLLIGTGNRMRHVKVRTQDETNNPALADLVKAAWAGGPDALGALKQRSRSKSTPR